MGRVPTMVPVLAALLSGVAIATAMAATPPDSRTDPTDPMLDQDLMEPEALARALASTSPHPLVLFVGFKVLFQGGHIPGARNMGPASKPAGIQALMKEVEGLAKDREIVLYCGCCPWTACPNIRPAFRALKEAQFGKVRVLRIPENFRDDWVSKGLPVEKGAE